MNRYLIALMLVLATLVGVSSNAQAAKVKGDRDPKGMTKLEGVLDKLELTTDQTAKCSDILSSAKDKIRTLMSQAKGSGDRGAMREKIKPIIVAAIKDVKKVLTPEQQTKFEAGLEELKDERRAGKDAPTTKPASAA